MRLKLRGVLLCACSSSMNVGFSLVEFHLAKQRAHHVLWVLMLVQMGHVHTMVDVVDLVLWWLFRSVLALRTLISVLACERRARSRR